MILSDFGSELARTPDEHPPRSVQTLSAPSRRPSHLISQNESSPSLGSHYTNGIAGTNHFSRLPSPQARRAGSAMTLKAHYDPTRSPLGISQQTSASSARDMALRKGCPEISRPSTYNSLQAIRTENPSRPHSRTPSANSKTSGNSIKRIATTPRRRPSVNDPPTLYPSAERTFYAVSPPPALINSALPRPLPAQQRAAFSGSKWWQKKPSSRTLPPDSSTERSTHEQPLEQNFTCIKVNVKKPKSGIAGVRNWFDGLEDDEPIVADPQHPELSVPQTCLQEKPPLSISERVSSEPRASHTTSRDSPFSNQAHGTAALDGKRSSRLEPSSPSSWPLHIASSPQLDEVRSKLSQPSRRPPRATLLSSYSTTRQISNPPEGERIHSTINGSVVRAGMNLQLESFLELSSSEDEDGETSALSEVQTCYGRQQIRASIEKASYDTEVSVSKAQSVKSARPRSVVNRNSNIPLSARTNSLEIVPPVPIIPDCPRPGPRTSSTRWRQMMEEKAVSTECTIDSRDSSLYGDINARIVHSRRSKRTPSLCGSKMMKVTQEEEKLLEAMREKRASIRQDDFEKGFKTAMQLQDIVSRPKTAGADGRNSQSSNSVYGSRCSTPPPPQEHGIRRTFRGSHLSASTDDLIIEGSYPFPEVPLNLKTPLDFASPSKTSPTLSFSPSDILPETPTSRNSPVTPTAGHGLLSIHRRGGNSPQRVTVTNNIGHERKRTSSSVVVLDGVEQHARELDEENAITGWAMDW